MGAGFAERRMTQDQDQGQTQDRAQDRAQDNRVRDDDVERELRPEDRARVDAFLTRGVNSVERKPFRPVLLLIMLIVVVAGLSLLSQWIAKIAGVY